MKRLLLLTTLIITSCGTDPDRTQDSRLYGTWLLLERPRNGVISAEQTRTFSEQKIVSGRSAVEYKSTNIYKVDTFTVSSREETCCWYTNNGEIFYTDTNNALRVPVESRIGYTINESGKLIFTAIGSRLVGDKQWEYLPESYCVICNIEAVRQ